MVLVPFALLLNVLLILDLVLLCKISTFQTSAPVLYLSKNLLVTSTILVLIQSFFCNIYQLLYIK